MEENNEVIKEILKKSKGKKNVPKIFIDFLESDQAKYLIKKDLERIYELIDRGSMIDLELVKDLERVSGKNRSAGLTPGFSARFEIERIAKPLTKEQQEGREMADTWTRPLTQAQVEGRRMAETWTEADRNVPESSKSGKINSTSKTKERTEVEAIDSPERNITEYEGTLLALREGLSELGLSIDEEKFPKAENPANQEYLDRRFRTKNFLEDFKSVLGPVKSVIDNIYAAKEEQRARNLADRSMREAPSIAGVRGRNRTISNFLREANIARSNPMQRLQPVSDQINVAYNQDIQRANELSGGQAGVATGLGQAAVLRRDEANRGLGTMASDVYNEGFNNAVNVAQIQAQDDASRDAMYQSQSRYLIDNNREDQRVAGQALAYSTARKLQARNNMYASLIDSPIFDVDTYMNLTKENLRGL